MTRVLLAALVLCLLVVARPAVAAYDARVEAAQRALAELGIDPGPVDGLMGRRTRAALEAFQKANDLEPTGRVDAATAEALGLDAAPASAPAPAPQATPAPAAKPPPPRTPARVGRLLRYERLGWTPPGSARAARKRSEALTGIDEVVPRGGELVVSDVTQIFLIAPREELRERCRPEAGQPSMEFLIGPDGPVNFLGAPATPLCQLGIGVVLREGMTLRMVESWWGEIRVPAGRVRVGREGLEYLR